MAESPQVTSRSHEPLPNGNIPEYACGPLTKKRYINPKIEQELVEFKQEIKEKHEASSINHIYKFPRPLLVEKVPSPVRSSSGFDNKIIIHD